MTTPYLAKDIAADEGCRLHAYPDPLSGAAPWTIGYGHTGADVTPTTLWTQAQADDTLAKDINAVCGGLDAHLTWWRRLDDARQDVLVNMAFNMGVIGLGKFVRTLAAINAGDWAAASAGMLESAWARQVPNRAKRLAQQMLTGERA